MLILVAELAVMGAFASEHYSERFADSLQKTH
jgi:hypothetical protein